MSRAFFYQFLTGLIVIAWSSILPRSGFADEPTPEQREAELFSNTRQLTFDGRRAGEGYFNHDGTKLCFQSEREPGNPFYQIYTLDLLSGDVERISPGVGKTTCAWIHPDGRRILFASTHDDPNAEKKQKEEYDLRASGQEKRYTWDYDENYELYLFDPTNRESRRLTNARGYDAEASISPDGQWIAFASNRNAFAQPLTESEQNRFDHDPSIQMDLYRMRIDGSELKQLTTTLGYDGGPFFDPTGTRLCFRRFSEDGGIAEIYTIGLDGSDERQLTRMGVMSWAPYYHPSGEYLVFTTNREGFKNFELYLVAADGKSEPVRVTYTDGFDGLAAFSPDGKQITWTSTRADQEGKQSQIYLADWDHAAARRQLGLEHQETVVAKPHIEAAPEVVATPAEANAGDDARKAFQATQLEITPLDLIRHIEYLCRPELEGRLTGTAGERLATAYVASFLESAGLEPAGENGTYFQPFEFIAGVSLGPGNLLADESGEFAVNEAWRPLAFSETGEVPASPVVFAGYGLVAPAGDGVPEYDSYTHLDVEDKWVLAFRYLPEDVSAETRRHWHRFASLRYKAMVARDRGAKGLILVSGTSTPVRHELVQLEFDGSPGGSGLPVISISNDLAARWLAAADIDMSARQKELDQGSPQMGVLIPEVNVRATIDIAKVRKQGRNVLARLVTSTDPSGNPEEELILLGAHVDHLGRGGGGSSLARDDEQNQIHFGADDNASGVAGVLEIAQYLAAERDRGTLRGQRDLLVAAWSGEELGLLGSSHFAKERQPASAAGSTPSTQTLYPELAACVNLDMIGRFDKKLVLQGIGSSSIWRPEIERRNVPVGLPLSLQDEGYLPTDANTFYTRGVPILSAFTGSHSDYHTPRDTPDKIDYDNAARISRLLAMITRTLVERDEIPDFIVPTKAEPQAQRAYLRAALGSRPSYGTDVEGQPLEGVTPGMPMAEAGIQAGDIVIELAGRKITNIYDYTYAIEALKVGEPVSISVRRGDEVLHLTVTPVAR